MAYLFGTQVVHPSVCVLAEHSVLEVKIYGTVWVQL